MSGVDPRRYQPCVEDWDEEAESPVPATRTTANVAVKRDLSADFDSVSPVIRYANDGTDSGYASQAPTISSTASMASSNPRRNSDLKSDHVNILERERKPYAMTATAQQPQRTSTKARPVETKELKPLKKPFQHLPAGRCWVCDKYGYHMDPKDIPKKEASKPPTPAQPSAPAPQPKRETPKPKIEEPPRLARRMSSNQPRPTSMYAAPPVQASYQQYVAMPTQGWPTSTPPPPQTPQQSMPLQYSYYIPPAGTPVYNLQSAQPSPSYYFEPQRAFESCPPPQPQPKPSRRTSMIIEERPKLEKRPSRTHTMMERPVALQQRPQITTQRSSREIDVDRAAMPPPPKPSHATINNTVRPKHSRSNTYHSTNSSNRHSYYEEDSDDDDFIDPRVTQAYREPPSPSRPPSSYRKVHAQQEVLDRSRAQHDVVERPRLQEKAHSYQQGTKNVQVATTRGVPRRRTTESAPVPQTKTIEQDVAVAEAYMRKRGSHPVIDLTAENLKNLKTVATRQVSDQRSDTGSTGSHRTHQSSSKDSSNGRGRGVSNGSTLGHAPKTSMNININGLNLAITDGGSSNGDGPPVKIDIGAVQLSMNGSNRDKENIDYRNRPQKQLERAPSMSSQQSRRSLTNSGAVSTGPQRREDQLAIEAPAPRDPRLEYSRRPSYVDEDEREALRRSAKTSRQASRNTSHSRQPQYEEMPVRPRPNRASVDYSARREESSVM